ncbi:MAG: CBS domain-containing protein [Nitrososphaeraceae archaeon]|jgi:acetoin utilization protein AcuB
MTATQDDVANVPVFDFMTRNVITIPESQTMKQASKLMYEDNIGSIVILKEGSGSNLDDNVSGSTTEKKEIPIGIVTERDIARTVGFAAKHSIFGDIPLSELMSKPLITIQPGASLKDAVVLMQQKDIRRLPIIDKEGQLVGIITEKDILRVVFKIFKKTIKDRGLISEGFDLLGFLGAE